MREANLTMPPPVEEPRPRRVWPRRLLLLAALALLIPAGTATLAGFNARAGWHWELFCHFRVQYFWALALSAVVLLALRRWIVGSVAVALAAANLAVILPLYFGPPQVATTTRPLRILSLNVHYLNRDYPATFELIERDNPDLVVLSEVTPAWINALKPLDLEYPYSKVIPAHNPSGIALWSRYPIGKLDVKRVKGINLPTIVAQIDLPPGKLTVIAAHPPSPGTAGEFEARNIEFAVLADIAADITGPRMVIGDMNTTGWSPFFQGLVRDSGLRDSRYGFGVEPSWPGLPLPLRIPIDHCLVSEEIAVANRQIGPAVGSDHRPLVVDFSY